MARSIKNIVKYLSEAEIIAINEKMVAEFGGLHGVRDLHLLRSAVGRPQMSVGFQDAYKSIFDKAVKFTKKAHDEDYTVEQISKWLKEHCIKMN